MVIYTLSATSLSMLLQKSAERTSWSLLFGTTPRVDATNHLSNLSAAQKKKLMEKVLPRPRIRTLGFVPDIRYLISEI